MFSSVFSFFSSSSPAPLSLAVSQAPAATSPMSSPREIDDFVIVGPSPRSSEVDDEIVSSALSEVNFAPSLRHVSGRLPAPIRNRNSTACRLRVRNNGRLPKPYVKPSNRRQFSSSFDRPSLSASSGANLTGQQRELFRLLFDKEPQATNQLALPKSLRAR